MSASVLNFAKRHPHWLVGFALVVTGLLVFGSGLRAWFTSDAWKFLEVAYDVGLTRVWNQFVPDPENWYRPLTRLVFQIEYTLFGLEPLGYHLGALAFHITTAFLIYLAAYELVRRRVAAVVAGFTFLLTLHAHEVIWSVGDLHNALGGTTMMLAVVAFMRRNMRLAWVGLLLNLLADETGLLTFALFVWYDALFFTRAWNRSALRSAVVRLAPFGGLVGLYFLARLWIGSGTILNEQTPCHAPLCLVNGMGEYLNRFFVRTDWLLSLIWTWRPLFAAALLLIFLVAAVVFKVWRWQQIRALVFAVGWMGAASFFYVWALWPYVADRFWYVPDMGLALLIGVVAAHALGADRTLLRNRIALTATAFAFILWLGIGVGMLVQRGQLWTRAGDEARRIVYRVVELVPEPPLNPTFAFEGLSDSYYVTFPPGNTGPYLFRNGIREALRLRYGRADVKVTRGWNAVGADSTRTPIYIRITPEQVELVER